MFMVMKPCTSPEGHEWNDQWQGESVDHFGQLVGIQGGKRAATVFQDKTSTMVNCVHCGEIGFRIKEAS